MSSAETRPPLWVGWRPEGSLEARRGMTATAEAPDVRQLASDNLPSSAFPAGGRQDFRVFFVPAAHGRIWDHASENVSIEICGVLVGRWERDAAGPFAIVSEYIRCDTAKSGF